jgi:hypothetical protein
LPTALEEIHLGYVAQLKNAPVDDDTRRASASRVRQYLGHRRLDHKREVRAFNPRRGPRGRRQAQKEANKLVSRECAANEHGFADLKNWRTLAKVRMNPRHATDLLRALLVLTRLHVTR